MAQIIDVNPEMGDWTGAMNMAMDQKKLDESGRQFDEELDLKKENQESLIKSRKIVDDSTISAMKRSEESHASNMDIADYNKGRRVIEDKQHDEAFAQGLKNDQNAEQRLADESSIALKGAKQEYENSGTLFRDQQEDRDYIIKQRDERDETTKEFNEAIRFGDTATLDILINGEGGGQGDAMTGKGGIPDLGASAAQAQGTGGGPDEWNWGPAAGPPAPGQSERFLTPSIQQPGAGIGALGGRPGISQEKKAVLQEWQAAKGNPNFSPEQLRQIDAVYGQQMSEVARMEDASELAENMNSALRTDLLTMTNRNGKPQEVSEATMMRINELIADMGEPDADPVAAGAEWDSIVKGAADFNKHELRIAGALSGFEAASNALNLVTDPRVAAKVSSDMLQHLRQANRLPEDFNLGQQMNEKAAKVTGLLKSQEELKEKRAAATGENFEWMVSQFNASGEELMVLDEETGKMVFNPNFKAFAQGMQEARDESGGVWFSELEEEMVARVAPWMVRRANVNTGLNNEIVADRMKLPNAEPSPAGPTQAPGRVGGPGGPMGGDSPGVAPAAPVAPGAQGAPAQAPGAPVPPELQQASQELGGRVDRLRAQGALRDLPRAKPRPSASPTSSLVRLGKFMGIGDGPEKLDPLVAEMAEIHANEGEMDMVERMLELGYDPESLDASWEEELSRGIQMTDKWQDDHVMHSSNASESGPLQTLTGDAWSGYFPGGNFPTKGKSNVMLATYEVDGKVVVVPTMVGGKKLSTKAAGDLAASNGWENYPAFADEAGADAFVKENHGRIRKDGKHTPGDVFVEDWKSSIDGNGVPYSEEFDDLKSDWERALPFFPDPHIRNMMSSDDEGISGEFTPDDFGRWLADNEDFAVVPKGKRYRRTQSEWADLFVKYAKDIGYDAHRATSARTYPGTRVISKKGEIVLRKRDSGFVPGEVEEPPY
jgi:hypothetical protein